MDRNMEDYRLILLVLARVFIEIRATKNQDTARILADIFHNAPTKIVNNRSSAEIIEKIYEIADRHKCKDLIESYFVQETRFDREK